MYPLSPLKIIIKTLHFSFLQKSGFKVIAMLGDDNVFINKKFK